MNTYATLLSTDDYLDGALVLNRSWQATTPKHPFVVFVTSNVSEETLATLSRHGIRSELIESWPEATKWTGGTHEDPYSEREWRWRFNHSKLSLFGMTRYKKIVFLDSDVLVLENIDELFERPHMSAVNAGGHLPELASWRQLNSGVLVIEPSSDLKSAMLERFDDHECTRGGDQEFLHAFYPSWPEEHHLHLDYGFNVFHTHLDRYHELFGLTLGDGEPSARIVHFYAAPKPWEQQETLHLPPPRRRRRPWLKLQRRVPTDAALELGPLAKHGLERWHLVHAEVTGRIAEEGDAPWDAISGQDSRGRPRVRWRKRVSH